MQSLKKIPFKCPSEGGTWGQMTLLIGAGRVLEMLQVMFKMDAKDGAPSTRSQEDETPVVHFVSVK